MNTTGSQLPFIVLPIVDDVLQTHSQSHPRAHARGCFVRPESVRCRIPTTQVRRDLSVYRLNPLEIVFDLELRSLESLIEEY